MMLPASLVPLLSTFSDRAEAVAGGLLLLVALALIIAEFFTPTHGSIAVGGLAVLIVGLILLADGTGSAVPSVLLVGLGVALALFAALVLFEVVMARHRPVTTGLRGLEHELGAAQTDLAPEGMVFIHGELWRAVSADGAPLSAGTPVRVLAARDLTLIVQAAAVTETDLPPTPGVFDDAPATRSVR